MKKLIQLKNTLAKNFWNFLDRHDEHLDYILIPFFIFVFVALIIFKNI